MEMELLQSVGLIFAQVSREAVLEHKKSIIELEPTEEEELDVFLKEAEEIRAEPEV